MKNAYPYESVIRNPRVWSGFVSSAEQFVQLTVTVVVNWPVMASEFSSLKIQPQNDGKMRYYV